MTNPTPVLFIGHGNPMNAIMPGPFTQGLAAAGKAVSPRPEAVCVVSAHWLTRGSFVNTTATPQTIYDFSGFPDELYRVVYPAPGSPPCARRVHGLVPSVREDAQRGLDHGAWTILKHLFPFADIPVFQLSIDYFRPLEEQFNLARRLRPLRDEGVLFIGSGNIVHNLGLIDFRENAPAYGWAVEFDAWVKEAIGLRDITGLIHYEKQGRAAQLSVPTIDHYAPLLYSLALADAQEPVGHFYEEICNGSLGMRCLRIR